MAQHPRRRRLIRVRRTEDALGARVTHVQVRLPLLHCYIRSWRSADRRVQQIQLEPPLRRAPQTSLTGQTRWQSRIYVALMLVLLATGFYRLVNGDMVALLMLALLALFVMGIASLDVG